MENNIKLTAIVLPQGNTDFNEQYRTLTLREGQKFSVGIKEFEEEKKKISDKIDFLNKEKQKVDSDLEIETNGYLDEANKRYKEGGNWLKMEWHNGKEVTHVQVSLDENIRIAREKADKIKKQKDSEIKKHQTTLDELEKTGKSIVWAWHLVRSRSSKPSGRNEKLEAGSVQSDISLGKHIYGGGFAWIEPFWEKGKPTGSTQNGLYVHTAVENPKVNIAEWYGFDETDSPKKINLPVRPGSKVQLHIYTEGMYGQNIGVELKANGEILKANAYERIDIVTKKGSEHDSKTKYEVTESENLFRAEVDIHDYSDSSSIKPPAGAVTGILIDPMENDKDRKTQNIDNVQKAVLTLYIDPLWCMGKKGIINILPTIVFNDRRFDLSKFPLQVLANSTPTITIPESGNKPVFVDEIETNFEAFHHCRYEKISAKFEEDGQQKELVVFSSQDVGNAKDNLIFPFVVGNDEAKREFEITVENAKTDECSFDNTKNDHHNHVINTNAIESRIIKGQGKYGSEWRLADVDKYLSGGEKKTESSGDENDDSKVTASHISNKFTFINGISKISAQKSFKILEKKTPFEFNKIPDQKIKMKIGYDFSFGGTVNPLVGLAYTFWPYSDATVQKYPVKIDTCAYQKNLDLMIYPDTKWTIQLGFNYDKEKFNEIRTQYHDKWKLQGLEAEEEKKRLQGKLEGTEENLKKYEKEKRKANKNDKGEWQGKIDQQRKKQVNLGGRINDRQEVIDQSKRKNSRGGQLSNAFDLMEPKNALASGLVDCELGIIAEFDRPNGALDLTSGYSEIVDFIKKIADIKDKINSIIDGKDGDAKKKSPSEQNEKIKKRKEKITKKANSKKSNWNFEFIPPSIALSVGWYAERPKDIDKAVMGTMIEGIIDFDPFFGFEIKYDLFQLLYRTHPAVAAIAFLLDSLDTIAGDNFDINLDLIVTTKAFGTLKGTLNTAEGSKYKDRLKNDEDDSPAKVGFSVNISIVGEMRVKGKPSLLAFTKYTGYAHVSASVESGVSMEFVTKIDGDLKLLHVEPEIKFEGLILKYSLDAGIAYDEEDKEINESTGVHFNSAGDIIVLDAYEWEIKNWRIPILKFS